MSGRSWVWVGLFGGLSVAVVIAWLLGSGIGGPAASGRNAESVSRDFETDAATKVEAKRKLGRATTASRGQQLLTTEPDVVAPALTRARMIREQAAAARVYPADAAGLERAVADRREDLDACHRTARYHSPDLPAQVTLEVTLTAGAAGLAVGSVGAGLPEDVDRTILEGCFSTVFDGVNFDGVPTKLSKELTFGD